ncbi:MAG: GNAT family N-acetyltransferase [Kineosporiaceae bacterium]
MDTVPGPLSWAMPDELILRDATADDAAAIAAVYNPYVADTIVTFEEEPVTAREMASRVAGVRGAGLPWLVADTTQGVVGYASAGAWRSRAAYRHSVEISAYLAPRARGRGVGAALYGELFQRMRAAGVHTVAAGIALPNDASVALHERAGMRKVAHFPEVGRKLGRWIDVGYWATVIR